MLNLIMSTVRRPLYGPLGYFLLVGLGLCLVFLIQRLGPTSELPTEGIVANSSTTEVKPTVDVVFHVGATLASVILLGLILGQSLKWIGQPPVIGEVMAGILLGPSLLGAIFPQAMETLVPPPSQDPQGQVIAALKMVAQLGVILYMFLVGLELNPHHLQKHARSALVISHTGIVVPFVLGGALSLALFSGYSGSTTTFTSFSLFMGVAMAITAFPVLARILTDQKLDRTDLGSMVLSCAATDDITAWCLLALVIGIGKAQVAGALSIMALTLVFIAFLFLVVRPMACWALEALDRKPGPLPGWSINLTFLGLLVCALTTEWIGVHAIIGAFLFGAILPNDCRLARELPGKARDLVNVLLLPAFFAFTGMRTEIRLISGWENLFWCAVIVAVATIGKFGGACLAARITGQTWPMAASIGILMNTRGLMELIVLNIGLDLGVISPTLFAMMVIMALVTTLATAPLLKWVVPVFPDAPEKAETVPPSSGLELAVK